MSPMIRGQVARHTKADGPSLRAVPFQPLARVHSPLLSRQQQIRLAAIATELHLPARMVLYREDTQSQWVFIVARGVVKAYRDLPSGRRQVMAFLFPADVLGLAEAGQYVSTAQTVTPAVLYRVRTDELVTMVRCDSDLGFQFLSKVMHELRASFRRSVLVGRRDAVGRFAMFLRMLETHAPHRHPSCIEVPMSRTDTANYLGLSLEAVCRASRSLQKRRIVEFTGVHSARIVDRPAFERLASAL